MHDDPDSAPSINDKRSLRAEMTARRTALARPDRLAYDRRLAAVFCAQEFFREAGTMLVYLAFRDEAATDSIIETALLAGKRVAAPRARRTGKLMQAFPLRSLLEVTTGEWGMREPRAAADKPMAPEAFDLIVVPGLAFTLRGDRLGYGGGYYDRYLSLIRPDAVSVGVGYEFQILHRLPTEPFDRRVDRLVTPAGAVTCADN
ncbi:MAG: 5-formyltetrahydrofolate cyclo-ligase [Bacilli bacterium]